MILYTPIFTAIFALIYVGLSLMVIRQRFKDSVLYGDGDSKSLIKAVRTHANFIEYVPLALILFWMLEAVIFNSNLVLILGSVLLVGRLLHVLGMIKPKPFLVCRQIGVLVTFSVLVVASLTLLRNYTSF